MKTIVLTCDYTDDTGDSGGGGQRCGAAAQGYELVTPDSRYTIDLCDSHADEATALFRRWGQRVEPPRRRRRATFESQIRSFRPTAAAPAPPA